MERYWSVTFVYDFFHIAATVTSEEEDHEYIIEAAAQMIFDTGGIDVQRYNDIFVEEV